MFHVAAAANSPYHRMHVAANKEPASDQAAQATDLLRVYGPAGAGGPGGDFSVIRLANDPSFLVGGLHPDILVYVSPADVPDVGAVPDQAGVGEDRPSTCQLLAPEACVRDKWARSIIPPPMW